MRFPRLRLAWHRAAGPLMPALLLTAALTAAALPARAQDIPPGTPPDVVKILRKMKSGQQPTMAEIQRLQQWGRQLSDHLNAPNTGGSQFNPASLQKTEQQGILCRVQASIDYTETSPGEKTQVHMNAWTKAVLFPNIQGNGDYALNALNPSVRVSSFRFEPYAPGGKLAHVGGGSLTRFTQWSASSLSVRATIPYAGCGFMLVTTGTGTLYPTGGTGGIGGPEEGTATSTDSDGSHTEPLHDTGLRDVSTQVPFAQEATQEYKAGSPTPPARMNLSYQAMVAAVRSSHPATVSGSESFDFTTKSGEHFVGHSTLAITLRPSSLELRIEPVDEATYERWLPLPDAKDSGDSGATTALFGQAKPLSVHLAIVDTSKAAASPAAGGAGGSGPTRPNAQRGSRIDVYLRNVSKQHGTCMNYPKAPADGKPDLFFPREQPAGIEYLDEQHVRTDTSTAVEATVRVAARDTGAYGVVQAECSSLGLQSHNARTDKQSLSVPMDDDENNLPDVWEKAEGIHGLPAAWDEEEQPAGMKSKGDGLTLFEEYRGFLVENPDGSESFRRVSPKRRKLFLYLDPQDKALHRQGAELYRQATGLDVIYLHTPSRMERYGDTIYPNWINFNETPFTKNMQRAVWVEDLTATNPGTTLGLKDYPPQYPQYPDTTQKVNVSRASCAAQVRYWQGLLPPAKLPVEVPADYQQAAAAHGIDLKAVGNSLPGRVGTLTDDLIVFVTVHELGHATGARHHGIEDYMAFNSPDQSEIDAKGAEDFSGGDHACPMRYWHFDKDRTETLLFLSGQWDLRGPSAGGSWKFCSDDWPNMAIKE